MTVWTDLEHARQRIRDLEAQILELRTDAALREAADTTAAIVGAHVIGVAFGPGGLEAS